ERPLLRSRHTTSYGTCLLTSLFPVAATECFLRRHNFCGSLSVALSFSFLIPIVQKVTRVFSGCLRLRDRRSRVFVRYVSIAALGHRHAVRHRISLRLRPRNSPVFKCIARETSKISTTQSDSDIERSCFR